MNDCPNGEVRDRLPDYLHERLSAEERAEVDAHLGSCADCRAELALLAGLRVTLRRTPVVDAAAIAAAIPPYRSAARRRMTDWRIAAAITLLAAGAGSAALMERQGAPHQAIIAQGRPPAAVVDPAISAPPAGGVQRVAVRSESSASAAVARPSRGELAVGSAAVSDLSDRELATLIDEIETLDVVPSADVDSPVAVSPVAPPRKAS